MTDTSLTDIPTDGSFVSPEGKWSWNKDALPAVLAYLTKQKRAVVFAQVWLVLDIDTDKPNHTHVLPLGDGKANIYEWELAEPWIDSKQPWEEFCLESHSALMEFVRHNSAGDDIVPRLKDRLFYHLDFVDEHEYADL